MVDSWCPNDHIRHFLYESIYDNLKNLSWEDRQYDILDFGSKWFGDPDGGWQTFMRDIFKDLVGTANINHILGTFPEYNIEDLHQMPSNSVDVVVADQVLEHVQRPWLASAEIHRVLKKDCLAIVATPGLYPIHPSPLDCWRIMPDGYKVLFPESDWRTIIMDMWGTRERVGFEYTNNVDLMKGAPTYTVEEAMQQESFVRASDKLCPMQLWWIGRKR